MRAFACSITVYCGIFPIVDFTNLFILGVTAALAWALPDQPINISEYLMEQYQNGTLPLLDREDSDVASILYQPTANTNRTSSALKSSSVYPSYDSYYGNKKQKNNYDSYYREGPPRNSLLSYDNRVMNEINRYSSKPYEQRRRTGWSLGDKTGGHTQKPPKSYRPRPNLRIYPALGKRSLATSQSSFEELFYLNHHRETRQDLYSLIEKYLQA